MTGSEVDRKEREERRANLYAAGSRRVAVPIIPIVDAHVDDALRTCRVSSPKSRKITTNASYAIKLEDREK